MSKTIFQLQLELSFTFRECSNTHSHKYPFPTTSSIFFHFLQHQPNKQFRRSASTKFNHYFVHSLQIMQLDNYHKKKTHPYLTQCAHHCRHIAIGTIIITIIILVPDLWARLSFNSSSKFRVAQPDWMALIAICHRFAWMQNPHTLEEHRDRYRQEIKSCASSLFVGHNDSVRHTKISKVHIRYSAHALQPNTGRHIVSSVQWYMVLWRTAWCPSALPSRSPGSAQGWAAVSIGMRASCRQSPIRMRP